MVVEYVEYTIQNSRRRGKKLKGRKLAQASGLLKYFRGAVVKGRGGGLLVQYCYCSRKKEKPFRQSLKCLTVRGIFEPREGKLHQLLGGKPNDENEQGLGGRVSVPGFCSLHTAATGRVQEKKKQLLYASSADAAKSCVAGFSRSGVVLLGEKSI